MKEIAVIFLITLIHGNDGSLYVQGPSVPVLENTWVVLNCRSTDPGMDLSQFHLRKLMEGQWLVMPCLLCRRSEHKERTSNRLVIPRVNSFWSGVYACISNNASAPDNSSQSLTLSMRQPHVENTTFFPEENKTNTFTELKTPVIQLHWMPEHAAFLTSPGNLVVEPGASVVMDCSISSELQPQFYWSKVGEDWMLDSPRLTLGTVNISHKGLYRCTAVEPGQSRLGNSTTVYVAVEDETEREFTSCFFRPLTWPTVEVEGVAAAGLVAAGVAAILVVILVMGMILAMGVFHFRAALRAKQAKGPIDDHSQKKPIYKGSIESLPSSLSGDTQPLV